MVRDRGMYLCTAENPGGTAQASAIVEVERKIYKSINEIKLIKNNHWTGYI